MLYLDRLDRMRSRLGVTAAAAGLGAGYFASTICRVQEQRDIGGGLLAAPQPR